MSLGEFTIPRSAAYLSLSPEKKNRKGMLRD